MQLVTISDVDTADLEDAIGQSAYSKGHKYAKQRAVITMRWDSSAHALHGKVRGRLGDFYETTAYFSSDEETLLAYEHGECSCPVGADCKHVAALVLTAIDPERARGIAARPSQAVRAAAGSERPAIWEQSLGSLLGSGKSASVARPSAVPLAIELTLSAASPPRPGGPAATAPKLLARVVKQGRNGWIRGGLSWTTLSALQYSGDHVASQVRLLQELYAVYKSGSGRSSYYSYGDDKSIDLSTFGSRQLWPMLDEAYAVGLSLVHSKKHLGELDPYGTAELCLDVTRDEEPEDLAVYPVVRGDGTQLDAMPIRFIGADGHGLVYVDLAEARSSADQGAWRLRLAKLARAVPPQLQRMALENHELRIPATEVARFRDEYYPKLRHVAAVISSDESFTPPVISDPRLTLLASYGADHTVDLSWNWAYEVGDSQLRVPLSPNTSDDAGFRDLAKERAVLAGLDLPLEQFALLRAEGDQADPANLLAPHTVLGGVDTMRFTMEVLPHLADQADVVVEVSGDPAAYREAGDSLSIGVSTAAIAGETDWFDLGVTITVEGQKVPFADVFRALATDQSYMLLPSGAYFSLEKPELQSLRTLIEEARALQDSPSGPLKISRFQVGLWDELSALGVVARQARAWKRQLGELRSIDSVDSMEPPAMLKAELRPYQLEGFRWLAFLWKFQLGGVLADDMGLGKTLQALALICQVKQADLAAAPFLIVAPTSVVSNWAAESARFAPGLKVVSISDTLRRRGQTLDEVIEDADVVVTSYALFRLDSDAYAARSWSGLILDEAQFAKNHQSKIYQCARRLPAQFKLAITGTPMENNLMELWSLLSITAPGLFPNPTRFDHYYARPIEKRGDAELLAQLRRRIKPLVKRRTKEQVASDLPSKQEQVLEVELHPRHRKIYQTQLQRERQKVLGLVDDLNKNRFTIFRSLTLLRQLSLHAGLIDEKHHGLPSAKVDALLEQLPDITDSGHRALIFSQFTGFLDVVRRRLDAEGVEYCYLDGTTRNRAAVLKRFKEGAAPVFLISLKAGGFGLNLTEADYCFLLDPWWNPATEAQAVDRIHRIGQSRNVMVYRLIAKDTIEEKVMALKARKAELFTSVMDDGNAFGAGLDADDIRGLFAG